LSLFIHLFIQYILQIIMSSDLSSLDILGDLGRASCKKRILNELVEFTNKGAYVHADVEVGNSTRIIINIILDNGGNLFTFVVPTDYPFKPPKTIYLNHKDYKQKLLIESTKTLRELEKYYGLKCLCCNTISCSANWTPCARLIHFIDEYKKIKQYRIEIIYRLLVPRIIKQYLFPDIDLLEWLIEKK